MGEVTTVRPSYENVHLVHPTVCSECGWQFIWPARFAQRKCPKCSVLLEVVHAVQTDPVRSSVPDDQA